MKKRTKKYIPLAQKQERALKAKIAQTYEFEMEFVIEDINKRLDAWRSENNVSENEYCPEWLVIDAYKQQSLIIALKMTQLKDPEYWNVGIDSHFFNAETEDVYTIPFSIELPQMSHADLMNGSDVKVNRGAGIKTRWKGLQAEMISHWESDNIPAGYELVQSQVYIKAHAKFKDTRMFTEYEYMLGLRDKGMLIAKLREFVGVPA